MDVSTRIRIEIVALWHCGNVGKGEYVGGVGYKLDASKGNILNIDAIDFDFKQQKAQANTHKHTHAHTLPHALIVYNKNICNFLLLHKPIDVNTRQQN